MSKEDTEAAEKIVSEEWTTTIITVSAEEYEWLMEKLEEPAQEAPNLRRLLAKAPVWLNGK